MDAGLLSIDEVCSPVQLILDHEFLSALAHMIKPFQVNEESIGLETILEAGPAGQYLDKEHTVKYLRGEHWQPKIWSREMLAPWLDGPQKLDVDKAREQAVAFLQEFRLQPPAQLPEMLEHEFHRIVQSARRNLAL